MLHHQLMGHYLYINGSNRLCDICMTFCDLTMLVNHKIITTYPTSKVMRSSHIGFIYERTNQAFSRKMLFNIGKHFEHLRNHTCL